MAHTAEEFQATVREYYQQYGRHDLPWRQSESNGSFDPYKILVSEIMLQQTQVSRVVPKYAMFLEWYPTLEALAAATLGDVLVAWQGLGYNRRAKYLWEAAQSIGDAGGIFPRSVAELEALPGIGKNTAAAIATYAFNQPAVFIETNIRTVYIHHFFHDQQGVPDSAIVERVAATLDFERPREWYWALMDYGANLKQTVGNLSRNGKAYTKQSAFAGSRRRIRGMALRLLASGPLRRDALEAYLSDSRASGVIDELVGEGLIRCERTICRLP